MPSPAPDAARRRAAAECLLEGMVEAGLDLVPPAIATAPAVAAEAPAAAAPTPSVAAAAVVEAPTATVPQAENPDLAVIAASIAQCSNCVLAEQRTQTVPGEGHPQARLMFVGEGPGADEDRSGRPFVGASGQLLEKIIENGMGLSRQEVFIANVVKCRPPQNRTPQLDEVSSCSPYLEQQIAAVKPELIIALGRPAAHYLLDTTEAVGSLRGKILKRPQGGPPILVTYHPAFLLYEPARKADCWADIQVAMRFLGLGQ
ncbi:MAG: uracil-DNA glycosylase [Planctomycetes bacterium]|nr:uracil-DNA glycosylase [Planctomycetota bacterium]MCP4772134.1 uracil-DNA glycosylase [Planctomycetota bacterium]MCP4861405.1 uracil-DNA glycosylase [Planctomycetota bacterium]